MIIERGRVAAWRTLPLAGVAGQVLPGRCRLGGARAEERLARTIEYAVIDVSDCRFFSQMDTSITASIMKRVAGSGVSAVHGSVDRQLRPKSWR
jgi:hypothetical protein